MVFEVLGRGHQGVVGVNEGRPELRVPACRCRHGGGEGVGAVAHGPVCVIGHVAVVGVTPVLEDRPIRPQDGAEPQGRLLRDDGLHPGDVPAAAEVLLQQRIDRIGQTPAPAAADEQVLSRRLDGVAVAAEVGLRRRHATGRAQGRAADAELEQLLPRLADQAAGPRNRACPRREFLSECDGHGILKVRARGF